jgi:type I restriction enzyme S subunit
MELGEVCEMIVDCEHKTAPTQEFGHPSIRTPNIGRGYFVLDGVNRVSDETYKLWTRRAIPRAGDLIMAREAPVGNVAMIPEGLYPCLGQRTLLIRCDQAKVFPRYLVYLLIGPEVQATIHGMTNGVTVPHLNMEDVRALPLPNLPPLPTQRKIAEILSAYDDLIENNTRRIRILEQMAQAVYREWFVHFRFPGHEGVKVVDGVPEGWESVKLSSLVETQYGYTESTSEAEIGPKFVRGMDINKASYIQWDQVPYCPIKADELPKYKLHVGDIMVIRMADPGKVGIVEKEVNAVFASYLIRLHTKSPKLSPYYLFYFLLSDQYQNYVTGASTGTTRKSASAGVITDIEIAIPPATIRQEFEDQIIALRKMLNNLLERNANLRQTRDLLLPRLVGGEAVHE